MSHSTVLVVLSDEAVTEHGVQDALALALEKFDENKDTPEYIRKTKAQLIEDQRAEIIEYRDTGLYAKYLEDPAAYRERVQRNPGHLTYVSETFPNEILPILGDDAALYKEATKFHDNELDEDGNLLSTYNPDSYRLQRVTTNHNTEGLVGSEHGQGSKAGEPAGNEVLFEVRDNEEAGGVPAGEAVTRRPLHVLLPVHQGAQQPADAEAAAGLDDPRQVQDGAGGVRRPAGEAGGSVRHLQGAAAVIDTEHGDTPAGGRSLPLDGVSAGLTVCGLQRGDRVAPGFTLIAGSRDELPVPPAGWEWSAGTVSGSKWDWYTIGGRWSGALLNWTQTIQHPATTTPWPEDAWEQTLGGVDIIRKRDLVQRRSTFAFLSKDGEWHEKGKMGWWGAVSNEKVQSEWDEQLTALVDKVEDDDWLVVVDVHI